MASEGAEFEASKAKSLAEYITDGFIDERAGRRLLDIPLEDRVALLESVVESEYDDEGMARRAVWLQRILSKQSPNTSVFLETACADKPVMKRHNNSVFGKTGSRKPKL